MENKYQNQVLNKKKEGQTMNTRKRSVVLLSAVALFLIYAACIPNQALGQKKSEVIKIGTYDSRIVTFAWSRSDYFKQYLTRISQQSDSAKKANDSARVKELSVQSMMFQHLLHQMVFSNGSIGFIISPVKDKLHEIAEKEGVSMILSKWELTYVGPTVGIVDVTNAVVQLFNPRENIDKMGEEIRKQPPVPLEELGIETEMLDMYCKRFGKK